MNLPSNSHTYISCSTKYLHFVLNVANHSLQRHLVNQKSLKEHSGLIMKKKKYVPEKKKWKNVRNCNQKGKIMAF